MAATMDSSQQNRASAAACTMQKVFRRSTISSTQSQDRVQAPLPSTARLQASLHETPYDLHDYVAATKAKGDTVLYLAYGSNLSNETFRGKRNIKPISQVNVQVPSLRLTFDLPGIPYAEPCFANSGSRDPNNDPPHVAPNAAENEKTPLLQKQDGYRKDAWHKGLIGVVYEVTAEDYAHIIGTEGGGASYHDVLVNCHPFASADPHQPVPQNPTLPAFKAHTLFAPAAAPGEPPKHGGRFQRPDISYAQPSARYLKLITDGAAELGLPYEYRDYLASIRPYTITSNKQRIGQFVFLATWVPIVFAIFGIGRMFQDDKGRLPPWMVELSGAVFKGVWESYDQFFKPIFGDGERSVKDGGGKIVEGVVQGDKTARRLIRTLSQGQPVIDPEKAQLREGVM